MGDRGMGVFRYLRLMRFPLVLTAVADSLAGYLVALGGDGSVDFRVAGLLALVSGALYCFGMACNDIADHDRDKLLHPDRVLPSGAILPRNAHVCAFLLVLLSGAAISGLTLLVDSYLPPVIWIAIVLLIVLYNFGGKKFSVGGPVLMGLVRACNFLLGMAHVGIDPGPGLFPVVILVYVICLTMVSMLEEGEPRRGIFVIGAGGMMAATIGAGFVAGTFSVFGMAGTLLLSGWLLFRIGKVWKLFVRERVMKLVRDGVMAIILLDASVVLWSGGLLEGILIASLLAPSFLMLRLFQRAARK